MTFPAVPRDVTVELYLADAWVDVTNDVRAADWIEITRGRPDEAGQPQPSTCALTLDNRSGNYSPRNPLGAYFGTLGRNTPIRVSVNTIRDTFTRTVVNGWGSTDTAHVWTHTALFGGSINDFDVTAGVGTHSVSVADGALHASLREYRLRDVDVTFTWTPPFADVLGGPIATGIMLRGDETVQDYYFADLWISFPEQMFLRMWRIDNGAFILIGNSVEVTDFVYTGQTLRFRAQVVGDRQKSKVWQNSTPEPYGWQLERTNRGITTAGWVGIRSDVYPGNTNPLPVVFTYDNLVVRSPRFFGEVAAWPQRWDTSGDDATAPVEAASLLRRLAQGTSPQSSTLYRGITGLPVPAVAYWPCEDGPDSSLIGSGIGGPPMTITGVTDFATYTEFAASTPIPVMDKGSWNGPVPVYATTSELELRLLMHVPDAGATDNSWVTGLQTTGGLSWDIKIETTGSLRLELWQNAVNVFNTGPVAFDVNGRNLMMTLTLTQDGTAVDYRLATLEAGAEVASFWEGSTPNKTVGRGLRVLVDPYAAMQGTAFGHVSVRKESASVWDLGDELKGFAGESALTRMVRLCDQNNVVLSEVADIAGVSAFMGPQRALPLLALLQECADADLGTLFDTRNDLSVLYREHSTLYSQPAAVVLDYAAGQVAPPFQPVDDDQLTRNDVTVTRLNGGSARAVAETGRMSVLEPASGGVGQYSTAVDVNVDADGELPDIAGWLLHLGTVDETRYPVVRVALHSRGISSDPELSAALLDLDVDDRFEITNPEVGQTPDTITQLARGYTETIGVFEHSLAINAAPASPYQVSVLDDTASRLDTDGSDLTAGITTTVTSFQVDVPSGVLWTTVELPITITVGGEEMSVEAVSGTASPQTFSSVTRSVNGIVKSHTAGTALTTRTRFLGL